MEGWGGWEAGLKNDLKLVLLGTIMLSSEEGETEGLSLTIPISTCCMLVSLCGLNAVICYVLQTTSQKLWVTLV